VSKRIFATVNDSDFYHCVENGREEDLDLGEVLSILCHIYATTGVVLADYKDWVTDLRRQEDGRRS
jgi:hypothetical protein